MGVVSLFRKIHHWLTVMAYVIQNQYINRTVLNLYFSVLGFEKGTSVERKGISKFVTVTIFTMVYFMV